MIGLRGKWGSNTDLGLELYDRDFEFWRQHDG